MRRVIEIKTMEELEHELDELELADEIETSGKWTYYQIIVHITDSIYSSLYGYPGLMPWIVRKTIGRLVLARILADGKMNPGYYNPSTPKEKVEGDAISALGRLRECIKEFKNWDGKFSVHPIFDVMDKQTWEKLHCIHASLHLSFVHPVKKNKVEIEITTKPGEAITIEPAKPKISKKTVTKKKAIKKKAAKKTSPSSQKKEKRTRQK